MRARLIGSMTLTVVALALPAIASAAGLLDTLALFNRILNGLIGLAVLAAILGLFWGIIKYFFTKGYDDKKNAIKIITYGVIVIFVMVSIWGIIKLLQSTFGVTQNTSITPAGIVSF